MSEGHLAIQMLNPLWRGRIYLLDDELLDTLAAGAIDGTLPTPGPGGARAMLDTNDTVSLTGGYAVRDGIGIGSGDPRLYYPNTPITRVPGRFVVIRRGLLTAGGGYFGFAYTNPPTTISEPWMRTHSDGVYFRNRASLLTYIGDHADYDCYITVLRNEGAYLLGREIATGKWLLLYAYSGPDSDTATMYAAALISYGAIHTEDRVGFVRVPDWLWLLIPILYDTFGRANGAIGSSEAVGPEGQAVIAHPWTGGATWTVASNKMLNTPTPGAELLTDPGLEGNYTAGKNDNLVATGSPNTSQSGDVHGGTKAQQMQANAQNERLYQASSVVAVGVWVRCSLWAKRAAGTGGAAKARFWQNTGPSITKPPVISATYTRFSACILTTNTAFMACAVREEHATSFDTIIFDDQSVVELVLAELLNIPDLGVADALLELQIAVDPDDKPVGIAFGWDSQSDPANGAIAYHDGGNVVIRKCVAGVWYTVATNAAAFSANALIKVARRGSRVVVYYDNVLIGTVATIGDATIVAGTRHGAFSTDAVSPMDEVLVIPTGSGGEHEVVQQWAGDAP